MAEFADLTLRIDASSVAAGVQSLDALTAAGAKAEKSAEKLTATQRGLGQSTTGATSPLREMAEAIKRVEADQLAAARSANQLVAANDKLASSSTKAGMAAKGAAVSFTDFHDAASRDFAAQYVQQMGAMAAAHGRVAASSKTLTLTTLNLSRQFADIGVTAAMGMSPLMIAIQQGPQIADAFAQAKTQGLGFKDALAGMARAAASLIVAWGPLIAGAAAVGAAFLLWRKHADDVKEALEKTAEAGRGLIEVQNATREAFSSAAEFADKYGIASAGLSRAIDAVIISQNAAYAETLAGIDATDAAGRAAVRRAELERLATVAILKRAAADATARAAISQGAVKEARGAAFGSGMIAAIGMGGNMEALRVGQAAEAAKFKALGGVAAAKAAAQELAYAKSLNQSADALMTAKLIIPEVSKAHDSATRAVGRHAGAVKALKEAIDRTQPAVADLSKLVNLDAPASTKGFDRTLKELNGELKTLPDITAKATDAMEEFYKAANDAGSGVDQMFYGLKNRDWMSAVSGLLRAAKAVQLAFGKDGTTSGKIGAIAGIADAAGQAIGGKAGGALSGAAAGAMGAVAAGAGAVSLGFMTAATLAGPVGWAIAGIGALAGAIFGLGGASKKAKAEAAEQRRAAEAAAAQRALDVANQRRQIELNIVALSGDAIATLAAQREAEMAGIDETNKALMRQLYALQDAKKITDERTALEVRYMQATGDEAGILAKLRAEETKGIDGTNRALLDLVYAQEDFAGRLAGAKNDLAAAYEREASAISATQDKFAGLAKTLREFGDSLDPSTSAVGGSYAAAKFGFLKTASGTDAESLAGIPDAGRAFIAASAANSRTLLAYQRDLATVRNATRAGENSALNQASIAEQQLAGIKAQVSGLITLNDSVLSLPAAIAALLAVQATAPTATPATVAPAGPSAASPNWTSYLANNPDVMAWAQSGHGDPTKPIDGQTLEDRAMYHYYNSGMAEGRTPFAAGGIFTNGIVSQPTGFNMGLMGEAGPEAIMPLVRGPRGLGVRAANDDGEIRALREQVAELTTVVRGMASDTAKLRSNIQTVTEDGRAMQTEAYA
ncbi:phage tail length tape measure family protein [Phenylobacterium sp.]|uniref:phage tail length tape measure family protein n=1 Tax=Phenylobacterium sp. TaxID=1871053 RepID=UPI00271D313C|nr:phage tail length tape measure family protein [Phenylobacterium sp.]MDO8800045.1 phage tail length tape measure family protein [Phenylobacterium sp.]